MDKSLRISLCALVLTGAFYAAGCSPNISDLTKGASTVMDKGSSTQKKLVALGPYIGATNSFNSSMVTFSYAISPSLEKMKAGTPQTHINLPNYDSFQKGLDAAIKQGSAGNDKIDANAKAVQELLKEIVPLAQKMDSYYDSRGYQADNYAEGNKMIQQYLPLEEKFEQAYAALDDSIKAYRSELTDKEIEEAKAAGKTNTAHYLEMGRLAENIGDMLTGDANQNDAAIEGKLQELSKMNDAFSPSSNDNSIGSYKRDVAIFIGETRTYLTKNKDPKALNDVIKQYNRMISSSNRVDSSKLDK